MSMTTLASTNPRTAAVAGPNRAAAVPKAKIAPHLLPNKAGQIGPVRIGRGIVNAGTSGRA